MNAYELMINVISLERVKQRRQSIERNFAAKGFQFNYFDAIDAQCFSHDELLGKVHESKREWKNYFRPGIICCALSHLGVYEKFINSDYPYCMVFEDDAIVTIDKDMLIEILSFFISKIIVNKKAEIILLNSYSRKKCFLDTQLQYKKWGLAFCTNNFPIGSTAYLINRKAAKKILKYNNPLKVTADQWDAFAGIDINVSCILPNIVELALFESSIDYIDNKMLKVLKMITPRFIRKIRAENSYRKNCRNIILNI
jgi:glycosyl transferase family 25